MNMEIAIEVITIAHKDPAGRKLLKALLFAILAANVFSGY